MSIAERDVTDHPDRGDDPISEFEEEFDPVTATPAASWW